MPITLAKNVEAAERINLWARMRLPDAKTNVTSSCDGLSSAAIQSAANSEDFASISGVFPESEIRWLLPNCIQFMCVCVWSTTLSLSTNTVNYQANNKNVIMGLSLIFTRCQNMKMQSIILSRTGSGTLQCMYRAVPIQHHALGFRSGFSQCVNDLHFNEK